MPPSTRKAIQYFPIHDGPVNCLSTGEPYYILSGGKDNDVVLYNYEKHTDKQTWSGHSQEVTKVVYGSVLKAAFSGSRDKSIMMWKKDDDKCCQIYSGHQLMVTGLAINNDNTVLCSGSRDNSICLWDVESGQCTSQNTIARNLVTDIKWMNNTPCVVQTSEDKTVRVWDTRTLEVAYILGRKQDMQLCCSISIDNSYCVTSSSGQSCSGCEVTLWDLRQQQLVCEFRGHEESVPACTFVNACGSVSLVASASNDGSIKLWDKGSAECLNTISLGGCGSYTDLMADGMDKLFVSSLKGGIRTLEIHQEDLLYLIEVSAF